MALAWAAQRDAQGQGKERSQRRGPQALEAEGHRPRARGLDPLASLAPWRHGPWTETARLQLRTAEENASRRAALGALGKISGAEADGRGCLDTRSAQDQGSARGAGEADSHKVGFAACPRQRRQSG